MKEPRPLADWRELMILVLLWGTSFALTRLAVAELHPLIVVEVRLLVGALVLLALLRRAGHRLPGDAASWLWFAWLALVGNVMPFWMIAEATRSIESALAGILVATVPLLTLALAPFFLRDEPFTATKLVAFLIGFAGVLVLTGTDGLSSEGESGGRLVAMLMVVGAAFGYALNGVTARLAPPHPTLVTATGVIISASVLSLPIIVASGVELPRALPGWSSIIAVVMLGIGATAGASIVLYRLLQRAGASFVSLSNYMVPCCAVLVGGAFMGESLAPRALLGMAIILSAVAFAGRHR